MIHVARKKGTVIKNSRIIINNEMRKVVDAKMLQRDKNVQQLKH